MSDFLSSLLLLIIGAILTGILVPFIAGQWQRHQKALEVKTELILDITGVVSEMMMENVWRHGGDLFDYSDSPQVLATKFPEWARREVAIRSRLGVYFPKSGFSNIWNDLFLAMFNYVAYETLSTPEGRTNNLDPLAEYLGEEGNDVDWNLLADESQIDTPQYQASDLKITSVLSTKTNELAGLIHKTRTYGEFGIRDFLGL